MKYRKKPIIIEAIQFVDENEAYGLAKWCGGWVTLYSGVCNIVIKTLEGDMRVSLNDWIIKGVNDEFYPCKPDIFEKTYEKVENE